MTPGTLFAELVRLQDDYSAKSEAARMKRPTSPQGIAKKAAEDDYFDFQRRIARDFFVMLACAAEDRGGRGLDDIADRVARVLIDRINFDAVAAQAHYANVKISEARMESEQLRRDVEELRRSVEVMQRESEPGRLKIVG